MGFLDAVSTVGDTIDKFTGGRAVRGILNGRPREALSILPFSDTLGITDARQASSGKDVLKNFGLTSDDDPLGGAKSFLAEAVLDPGTLFGGAGFLKAGAKRLGKLAKLDEFADAFRPASYLDDVMASKVNKFDDMVYPPQGMKRSDPEWLNNKTFYHGTGTPGMTSDAIDTRMTSPAGLYGRGFYTTADSGSIPEGYAKARSGSVTTSDSGLSRMINEIHAALPSIGDTKPISDRLSSIFGNYHRQKPGIDYADSLLGKLASQQRKYGYTDEQGREVINSLKDLGSSDPGIMDLLRSASERSGYGYGGTIYNYTPNIHIPSLDLELPWSGNAAGGSSSDFLDAFDRAVRERYPAEALGSKYEMGLEFAKRKKLSTSGADIQGASDIYRSKILGSDDIVPGTDPIKGVNPDSPFDPVVAAIKDLGYNTVTHTGGLNTNNPYHQVLIHLDPTNKIAPGKIAYPNTVRDLLRNRSIKGGMFDDVTSPFIGMDSPTSPIGSGSGGAFSALRPLADFPMIKEGTGELPRIVGGQDVRNLDPGSILDLIEQGQRAADSGWAGMYNPRTGGVALNSPDVPSWVTGRHERVHGIIDRASRLGGASELPLSLRVPAALRGSDNRFLKSMGKILDETAATGLGYRSPRDQMTNAASFLLGRSPEDIAMRSEYGQIMNLDPMARAIFQNAYRVGDPTTYGIAGVLGSLLRSAGSGFSGDQGVAL